MKELDEVKKKLRLVKREWRGDSKLEFAIACLESLVSTVEAQQWEIGTLRSRLEFLKRGMNRG